MFKSAVFCAILAMGSVGAASAATVDFTGAATQGGGTYTYPTINPVFSFDDARIGPDAKCNVNPCLRLNDNETTTITRIGGGTFSLTSLYFMLVGAGSTNALKITSTGPAGVLDFTQATYEAGEPYFVNVLAYFTNVTSITFSTAANGGNVRIDDIGLVPSPVPVPAAAGMLALALGGLGLAGRRKKA